VTFLRWRKDFPASHYQACSRDDEGGSRGRFEPPSRVKARHPGERAKSRGRHPSRCTRKSRLTIRISPYGCGGRFQVADAIGGRGPQTAWRGSVDCGPRTIAAVPHGSLAPRTRMPSSGVAKLKESGRIPTNFEGFRMGTCRQLRRATVKSVRRDHHGNVA